MKRTILIIALTLFLSGCAGAAPVTKDADSAASSTLVADLVNQNLTASAPTAVQPPPQAASVQLTTDYAGAVSIEMQLLLGSIKLEGTALAITKEQASVLQPLWMNFKTISQSMMPAQSGIGQGQPNATPQPQTVNTEAQAQLDEITKQIQSAMTPEQIKAIAAMQFTQESSQAAMQELGIALNNSQAGNGGQPPQGDMPQGTPPAGGPGNGQPPAGADPMGTPPADGMQRDTGFIPQELVDSLIQLLGQKISI